jgi:histidyl-tRNA synthetase
MASNASIPKGTRDFSPTVIRKRNYITQIVKTIFELYGFDPIETPAFENLETLTGKYGDEGDKLMFKIRSNRNIYNTYPDKAADIKLALKEIKGIEGEFLPHKPDMALRYDLTIPFARYVVMNRSEINLPFKRYQIQPVWRADNPQAGRYREFYQCDVDIIGSNALLNEAALLNIYMEVMEKLHLNTFQISINNRKILAGLAQLINAEEKFVALTVAIDKLDKIMHEGVIAELIKSGFDESQTSTIISFLNINGTTQEMLTQLKQFFSHQPLALTGISELETILSILENKPNYNKIKIDTTLARGLNYYTGLIVELKNTFESMGSLGGGGRYDNLTGVFGWPNISGVGISFGLDRIYNALESQNLFPNEIYQNNKILLLNFGHPDTLKLVKRLELIHAANLAAEIYPDNEKMKKQMEYANKCGIKWVVFEENEQLMLKNMNTGEQTVMDLNSIIDYVKSNKTVIDG